MTDQPVPNWKFWHPLPWWKMLLILLVFQMACQLTIAVIFTTMGWSGEWVSALGGGLGGGLGVMTVQLLAKRAKAAEADETADSAAD